MTLYYGEIPSHLHISLKLSVVNNNTIRSGLITCRLAKRSISLFSSHGFKLDVPFNEIFCVLEVILLIILVKLLLLRLTSLVTSFSGTGEPSAYFENPLLHHDDAEASEIGITNSTRTAMKQIELFAMISELSLTQSWNSNCCDCQISCAMPTKSIFCKTNCL